MNLFVYSTAAAAALALALGASTLHYRGEMKTARADLIAATERGRTQAYEEAFRRTSLISDLAVIDHNELLENMAKIVEESKEKVVIFRDRVIKAPPVQCGPGTHYVDAVNEALSHGGDQ